MQLSLRCVFKRNKESYQRHSCIISKHYMRKMNYYATHVKSENRQQHYYHHSVVTAKNMNNQEKGMRKRAPFLRTLCPIIDFFQIQIPFPSKAKTKLFPTIKYID